MRDFIVGIAMLGILVGVGLSPTLGVVDPEGGAAQAESNSARSSSKEGTSDVPSAISLTKAKSDLAQYQTPQSAPSPATSPTELPATNPPYALIGAVGVAIGIAVVAYFILR